MPSIDVTVIVPTFRRPQQLVDALVSALAQEGASLEVRVIDDSPEGSAREVVESIGDPRVTYMKRAVPSLGRPAIVRNEAWPLAQGRYVHFLDDDDVLVPGAYAAHLAALESNPDAVMSFGCIEAFGDNAEAVERETAFWRGGAERARRASRYGRFGFVATLLFEGAVLQNSACMVRKTALEETGGFDALMPLQEDTEMHARGTRLHGCVFVDRTVIRYRVNAASLMRSGDVQTRLNESYARMHRKYRDTHGHAEFLALKVFARGRAALSKLGERFGLEPALM
ncbi:MAG TPA: glycosyltransferase family 2 protein [Polyangiaceae bacterium]|jgi:GT2 family glycosyltransferase|nr:glycosyltransferase family 2 protein [Polyangiaceae bacterium]